MQELDESDQLERFWHPDDHPIGLEPDDQNHRSRTGASGIHGSYRTQRVPVGLVAPGLVGRTLLWT